MRIDEIDLYGKLLISGSTGSEGQILTYGNDGGFAWGTASGGSSGPTSSYFKTSGYNYVICETVNTNSPSTDAITNGDNLFNAYTLAKNLDVGGLSATNRVVVLLMPGDYDLSSDQFHLDTSFIDIVGISSNPYNTILRSSAQFATLFYVQPVDSVLKNVHLKQGTYLSVSDAELGGDGSYLRWENLIISGYCFQNGVNYGFSNIYGEFKNIKMLDNSGGFVSIGNIDGIFDNIEIGENVSCFSCEIYPSNSSYYINGTFSNITCEENSYVFNSFGKILGSYKNIKIPNAGTMFQSAYDISGNFENITGGGLSSYFNTSSGGSINGTFKHINLGVGGASFNAYDEINGVFENIYLNTDGTQAVFIAGLTLSGTFSNINIGDVSQSFWVQNNNSFSGSFKDITIGNVSDSAFKSVVGINGTYENMTIGNVTNDAFKATDYISGTFKNITIGDITNNHAFYADSASGQINGTFDEIKIGNIASTTGYFFTSGATISGTFSNIEIGDASQWNYSGIYMFSLSSSGSITGSYKNIKVNNTSFLFYPPGQDLNGTFENIEFGSTVYAFYTNAGSILGTYSNIKTSSQQERIFYSNTDLIGTFENIEISNSITTSVFTANSLSGIFKNIKLGDLSGIDSDVFYSGATDLTGTFENIEVGNGNSSWDIFKSGGNISGTFSNITVGDGWNYVFSANAGSMGISGYYKDIYIPALVSDYGFYGASVSSTTIIDNLWCDNRFYAGLGGKLLNSSIFGLNISPGWGLDIQADGTIVENCKIIGQVNGPPDYTIYSSTGTKYNVQILYTVIGTRGLCPETYNFFPTNTGIVPLTPNYNIENYT